MIFLDDVDCAMVSCFMSVFILCIERKASDVTLGTFFLCLLFSLMSFWIYFVVHLIKDYVSSYVGNKKFTLYLSVYQSSYDKEYCGDCYDYFDYKNKKYVLFSDGMYVGEEAFKLSSEVLSSIRCGIEGGYDVNDVVSNCSKCMSREYNCESFSTLDLLELNGNKLSFIKRGAENSLFIRNKDVISVNSDSLPMGVDGNNTSINTRVRDEDVLVIYSDGVKEKYPLFDAMIKDRVYGDRLESWIEKLICEKCDGQRDDMSVLVIKFVDIS
jgi:stage II sporulation protein E